MNVRRTSRSAFTLIELLIVIGIIGVVVALGVPLFGVLTGAKSQEAGQNLVAAAIGQARTVALSEGKYAGVLFYIDPATERTAMTIVTRNEGLEDPDPYDKYKTFVGNQVYKSPFVQADGTVVTGDRTIGITSDASATFRATPSGQNVYAPGGVFSNLSLYFGNFKPTVKVYRGIMKPNGGGNFASLADADDTRPPRSGPFGYNPTKYRRIPAASNETAPANESDSGTFTNESWSIDQLSVLAVTGGERQLLPLGVGVQVLIPPTLRNDLTEPAAATAANTNKERYVRVGAIMFDPQGKLTIEPNILASAGTLGTQLGLAADVKAVAAGVGVVFYDRAAFKLVAGATDGDFLYQNVNVNLTSRIQSTQSAYNDNQAQPDMTQERGEETWLDQNTVPLLINRYSGALSEAQ